MRDLNPELKSRDDMANHCPPKAKDVPPIYDDTVRAFSHRQIIVEQLPFHNKNALHAYVIGVPNASSK